MLDHFSCVVGGNLKDTDWRNEVASNARPMFEFAYLEKEGAKLYGADTPPRHWMRKLIGTRFNLANYVLNRVHPRELIYCVSEEIGIPFAILASLRRKKNTIFIGIHGHYFQNKRFIIWIKSAKKNKRLRFICLAESLREKLISEFSVDPSLCHTLGVAVDVDFHQPNPEIKSAQARPLIVSAGAAGRDYKTLIAAARPIDADFEFASGSSWLSSIEENDLPAHIKMGSRGNFLNLRELYKEADIMVVPLEDTFHATGYAVMVEAMAMGLPVIASRTQAPSDFVIEGKTGLLVSPGDVEGLRRAIQHLIDNPELRAEMGRNARALMVEKYSLSVYAKRLMEINVLT